MINYQRGQTLLEAVIALAAMLLIITAISITVTGSLSNSGFIGDQNKASKFAQEGIEYLRNIRNTDYNTFSTYQPNVYHCMPDTITGPSIESAAVSVSNLCNPNVPQAKPIFKRSVILVPNSRPCGNTGIQATVTVSWLSGKCESGVYCQQSTLSACFSDSFNVQPTL